ncbi:MAG: hypothetical protein QME64_12015, partial [bacterium]|nr:hypothetical protein [bacterium]
VLDARSSSQKNSTIEKIYSSLKDYIRIARDDFYKNISNGIKLQNNIVIQLNYGTHEIAHTLFLWTRSADKNILKSIETIIHRIENWDDLWLVYAITSIELELKYLHKVSNIKILNHLFDKVNISFDFTSYTHLVNSIDKIANEVFKIWKSDSIPLKSPSDSFLYIKDLLFLKACYEKIKNQS